MRIKSFKALNDYILIDPVVNERKTRSGIIIPETAEETIYPSVGKVLSAGEGYGQYTRQVNDGEILAYNKNNTYNIALDLGDGTKDFKLIRQIDAYGVIITEDEH
jgi:chaperonin GroES